METFVEHGLTARILTTDKPIEASPHQDIECNFIDRGQITYLMGASPVTIEPGRWMVFWAALPHHIIHIDADVNLYRLTIPLAWFLRWNLPVHIVEPVMKGDLILDERGDLKLDQAMFKRWCSDLDLDAEEREAIVMLEVEARIRRLAFYASVAEPSPWTINIDIMADVDLFMKAKLMAEYITQYYRSSLNAQQVAETVDLAPDNASRLFQMYFQYSIEDYITKYRIAYAQTLLITTDYSPSAIAPRAGFDSKRDFISIFKDACGYTPRAYRSLYSIE